MGPAEFTLNLLIELLGGAIQGVAGYTSLPFFARRRVNRRIEDATADVVEPLMPFLQREGVSEEQQRILIATCIDELRPITRSPEILFQQSLNGQQIFESLYATRTLPALIIEEGLREVYALLFPRIATLVCKIPAAVKDWEAEAWSENYRRFDDLAHELRTLFTRVDELVTVPIRQADETLALVRRAVAQKIGLEMEVTGLRADRPLAGKFDDFFVHPQIRRVEQKRSKRSVVVETTDAATMEFVRPDCRAVVIGHPGAGKSTWSKWLQRQALTPRWEGLAVRLELRTLVGSSMPSMHDVIRFVAGRHLSEDITTDRIAKWLSAHRILFILDGFDEIRPAERDAIQIWIAELAVAAKACPFILTSRPLTTEHLENLGANWKRWTIEPFDETRVFDYIERWHKHVPVLADGDRRVDVRGLASRWRDDPTIGPLTGNPLLLSTLLMVHHLDGSLPAGRAQLYRRYVEGMLGLWDDRRKVSAAAIDLSLEEKRQILRALALHLFMSDREQIDETELLTWLTTVLASRRLSATPRDVLTLLMERSGLINGPGVITFTHKSIIEYLVAEAVLQGVDVDLHGRRIDRFLLFEYRDNDRWNTVTFLWSGLAPVADVESFIDQSLDVGNMPLACGILLDQYERFTRDIRRRLLLRALVRLEADPEAITDIGHSFVVSGPIDEEETDDTFNLIVPGFRLRGVRSFSALNNLFWRASADGSVVWDDAQMTSGQLRQLLWMNFASRPRELETWRRCLSDSCPESATRVHWLFWVGERAFTWAARTGSPDLIDVTREYVRAYPDGEPLVPLILFTVVLAVSNPVDGVVAENIADPLARVMQACATVATCAPHDWLSRTLAWSVGFGESIGDLLSAFLERLDVHIESGDIRDDEYVVAVRQLAQELRHLRDLGGSAAHV